MSSFLYILGNFQLINRVIFSLKPDILQDTKSENVTNKDDKIDKQEPLLANKIFKSEDPIRKIYRKYLGTSVCVQNIVFIFVKIVSQVCYQKNLK